MTKEQAAALMEHLLALSEPLNKATDLVSGIADHDEQIRIRKVLGLLMTDVYIKLMLPIIQQHPELDPDGTDGTQSMV